MKTICSNCEAENNLTAKYCSVCGHQLPAVAHDVIPTANTTQQKKAPKQEKKFSFKTILGFIIGFVIMFFVSRQVFGSPSMDKQLVEIANQLNKTCPMRVDQYTTLKNVVALPNKTLQYNYILTKSQVNTDDAKKSFFPTILENVRTNPDMKLFRDNEVTLKYYYSDKSGEYVMEYKILPEMYQ
jgi:hypothetical protein